MVIVLKKPNRKIEKKEIKKCIVLFDKYGLKYNLIDENIGYFKVYSLAGKLFYFWADKGFIRNHKHKRIEPHGLDNLMYMLINK